MIPEIGLVLCALLAFKGFEILIQVALASPSQNKETIKMLAIVGFILAVIIAGFFAWDFVQMGNQASRLPYSR